MKEEIINHLKVFYDGIYLPLQVFDESGNLIFVNKAFSLKWNYVLSENEPYNIFNDAYLGKTALLEIVKKSFANNKTTEIDGYADSLMKGSNKAILPIYKTQILPLSVEGQNLFLFIHQDQTEIFLAETELKKSRETSKEADRLKNTFLNVLSHELRTPLNIILGYSTIIKESLKDKLNSEEKIYLENLYNGSERLFKSISQMLEFAQLEAGNFNVKIETIDLVPMLQYNVEKFKQQALEKNIDLKSNIKEQTILVDTDVHCIENSLQNLLSNALKFTSSGFVEVEAGIMKEHELAFCKIRDSGVGISSEYMEHLYLPFSQEDLKLSRNYEGNGLGLAITKRYIERVGGSLIADSVKGVGSTFTITLPLSRKRQEKTKTVSDSTFQKIKKVLMLDESGETSELIKIFTKDYAEVYTHPHESFFNYLIKNDLFQVVILDVSLNQWQDGISLCREITQKDPYKRPVIILSGETDKNKINEFYKAGAVKFIVKPFNRSEIIGSLKAVI